MRKFRRSILGGKGYQEEGHPRPEPINVHLESTSTVLDDLRGQPTWEEEWKERHPGMAIASNHERKVHLLSDVLGQADGMVALREILQTSPALRALMAEAGVVEAGQDYNEMEESLRCVEGKLDEGSKFKEKPNGIDSAADATNVGQLSARRKASPREFYHHRDKLRSLLLREENTVCADCTAKQPTWASVNLGVFLCTHCAGCHRSMGVHISKVLSVQLDEWSEEQVDFMGEMGNGLTNIFLEYHVPSSWQKPSHREPRDYRESYVKAKYQDRLFEFRGRKKPVVKAPPPVDETLTLGELSLSSSGKRQSQAMTEYIGFVNIVLVKGKGLVPPGMIGQLQYMTVLRIGTQEVRSRSMKADGNPTWSEKLRLCWDGTMPLNIDVYGGKEHIGQAEVPLRKYLLEEDHDGTTDENAAASSPLALYGTLGSPLTPISISGGGMDQSTHSESSSSGPPTLSSLSATNSTATTPTGLRSGQTTRNRVSRSLLREVAVAALDVAASAASPRGCRSASPSPSLGAADGIFGYGGYPAAAATPPSEKAIGGGGNRSAEKATTTAEGKRVFVQPMPASVRVDSVEKRSSHGVDVSVGGKSSVSYFSHRRGSSSASGGLIEELENGDLYVSLINKNDERSTVGSPMPGSATASPRPALNTRNVVSTGGGLKGKGLKNPFLGRTVSTGGASSAGGVGSSSNGGGGYGNGGSRPAQGGVIIKMDLVRIEH